MNDIICGIGTAVTTFTVSTSNGQDLTISIIASVISAFIFALINIGTKILTSYLERKGLISKDAKRAIDETADDLSDDGQINNSNKKDSNDSN